MTTHTHPNPPAVTAANMKRNYYKLGDKKAELQARNLCCISTEGAHDFLRIFAEEGTRLVGEMWYNPEEGRNGKWVVQVFGGIDMVGYESFEYHDSLDAFLKRGETQTGESHE